MKNSTGMYNVARAKAVLCGPRRFKRYAGYALTDRELYELYLLNGFSTNKNAMKRHIEAWKAVNLVLPARVGEDENVVYFFQIDGTRDEDGRLKRDLCTKFPEYSDEAMGVLAL